MEINKQWVSFAQNLRADELPAEVVALLRRSLLDTLGVALAGSQTKLTHIVHRYVSEQWCAGPNGHSARLLFNGTPVAAAGAAMGGAFCIDSIDAHDGYSHVKGHAGSALFPGIFAILDLLQQQGKAVDGEALITALAIGYEVAYRSGLTLHATTSDYHTSGAWTAVGLAAACGRLLGLDDEALRHAVGIAEYHGPRSQMMRCIDFPSMLRDGVGWGAPSGVSAAQMAELGFTGAPAITIEAADAQAHWQGLGETWSVLNTHYKRYPVCRWAHPSIDAVRELMAAHQLSSSDIERVTINTFHYATRLAGQSPNSLDELTYAIIYPVATMIARGQIGLDELKEDALHDAEIRRIANATSLVDSDHYTKISVEKRWADVCLHTKDGRDIQSEPKTPKGDPDDPLSDAEISEKYHGFADVVIGKSKADELEQLCQHFEQLKGADWQRFQDLIYQGVS